MARRQGAGGVAALPGWRDRVVVVGEDEHRNAAADGTVEGCRHAADVDHVARVAGGRERDEPGHPGVVVENGFQVRARDPLAIRAVDAGEHGFGGAGEGVDALGRELLDHGAGEVGALPQGGDQGREDRDEVGLVHRVPEAGHHVVSGDDEGAGRAGRRILDVDLERLLVPLLDQRVELRFEIGVGGAAHGILLAAVEEDPQRALADAGLLIGAGRGVGRVHRVDHGRADALGMAAQHLERDRRPVRHAEQIPLFDAERVAQVGDVVGCGGGVIGVEVDALGHQVGAAVGQHLAEAFGLLARWRRGAEDLPDELDLRRAVEARGRLPRATLVEHDHVAAPAEVLLEEAPGRRPPHATGPAREVDDRVGERIGRRAADDRDREGDVAAPRMRPVDGHGEHAALDAGVGREDVVARRGVVRRLVGRRRAA